MLLEIISEIFQLIDVFFLYIKYFTYGFTFHFYNIKF